MITTPTCLILGAGASMPYGFPSGFELKDILCECSDQSSDIHQGLSQAGYKYRDITEFGRTLQYSGLNSIDSLLEKRPNIQDVGKAAISWALLKRESKNALFYTASQAKAHLERRQQQRISRPPLIQHDQYWYNYLFQLLTKETDANTFIKNHLKIITFNYDRSLETFLLTAFLNAYGKGLEHAEALLNHLEITHVHGIVASHSREAEYGWIYPDDYPSTLPALHIQSSNTGIQTVSEASAETSAFKKAQEILETARRIHFLGFSYHPGSLNRLGFKRMKTEKFISGTTYKMGPAERAAVKEYFRSARVGQVSVVPARINLVDADALGYLKTVQL